MGWRFFSKKKEGARGGGGGGGKQVPTYTIQLLKETCTIHFIFLIANYTLVPLFYNKVTILILWMSINFRISDFQT